MYWYICPALYGLHHHRTSILSGSWTNIYTFAKSLPTSCQATGINIDVWLFYFHSRWHLWLFLKRENIYLYFYDIFSSSNVVSFYNRQNLYQMLIIDNIYLIIRRTFLWVHFCCETCKYKYLKELNFPENKTISDLPRHKQLPWT